MFVYVHIGQKKNPESKYMMIMVKKRATTNRNQKQNKKKAAATESSYIILKQKKVPFITTVTNIFLNDSRNNQFHKHMNLIDLGF